MCFGELVFHKGGLMWHESCILDELKRMLERYYVELGYFFVLSVGDFVGLEYFGVLRLTDWLEYFYVLR